MLRDYPMGSLFVYAIYERSFSNLNYHKYQSALF